MACCRSWWSSRTIPAKPSVWITSAPNMSARTMIACTPRRPRMCDTWARRSVPASSTALVVIQNDTGKAISVDHLRAEYVGPNHDRVYATSAKDVRYLRAPQRPNFIDGPAGRGAKVLAKKNPLDAWEIEGRAFTAQMLPAGNTASGFLYFQTGMERGATIYITGLADAATGKELLFFELPLN